MLARIQKAYVIFLKNLIKTKPKVKQWKWYNVYRTYIKCKTTPPSPPKKNVETLQ